MYRRVVPDGYGMLFDFGEVREANFWMRNTYVSLDILFVNADGTIHRIAKATQPLSDRLIPSRGPVRAVFEVVAGTTDRLGIRVGDVLIHEIFANTGR